MMCQYSVNLVKRFSAHPRLRHLVPIIEKLRFIIPSLHIQNHKEDCMYEFSSAYLESAGHFFGETAEMVWPELNELGGQTRQMNNGHRQGVLEDKFGHWNWVKTENMGERFAYTLHSHLTFASAVSLVNDLHYFITLWAEKREFLVGLSRAYQDKLEQWKSMDRTPVRQASGYVRSVYRHNPDAKGMPSRTESLKD